MIPEDQNIITTVYTMMKHGAIFYSRHTGTLHQQLKNFQKNNLFTGIYNQLKLCLLHIISVDICGSFIDCDYYIFTP